MRLPDALRVLFALGTALGVLPSTAIAVTYYIGPFAGSTPHDDSDCGGGKEAHSESQPSNHPCASLQYWNQSRRKQIPLRSGDIVRLAPGTYTQPGGTQHCILLDQFAKGVTYEGRTANDGELNNHDDVIIDLTGISSADTSGNPCQGGAIMQSNRANCNPGNWSAADDYSGVVIRDLQFKNATANGGQGVPTALFCGPYGPGASNIPTGIMLDTIRLTGSSASGGIHAGHMSGSYVTDNDCSSAARNVRDITIVGVQADNLAAPGGGAGITLACVDGFRISGATVFNVCTTPATCKTSCISGDESACDDRDGIVFAGAINGVLENSEVYNVGEDGIDVGGHPLGKSHHITVRNNWAHDSPGNLKASGARYVAYVNNIVSNEPSRTTQAGFSQYSCSHHLNIWNNTIWGHTQFYVYLTNSSIQNNIFRHSAGGDTVFFDRASTNSTNRWQYNVVVNEGIGGSLSEYDTAPNCLATTQNQYDCRIGYEPPPTCDMTTTSNPVHLSDDQTGAGKLAGATGSNWFGTGNGAGEKWGTRPLVEDAATPNRANLHLKSTDTIAKDAGVNLAEAGTCGTGGRCATGLYGLKCATNADCGLTTDHDGHARGQGNGWDIGADEVPIGGSPNPPGNLRVLP